MSLPWIRLDTQFPHNPKILMLAEDRHWRAAFAYIGGLCYVGGQGTDGFIPRTALPLTHATRRDAERLVEVGLWVPNPVGWDINGWDDKQAKGEEMHARKTRAYNGAMARWHPEKYAEMKGQADA